MGRKRFQIRQGAAVDCKESRHGIGAVYEGPRQQRCQTRIQKTPQAPDVVNGAARHVAAADYNVAIGIEGAQEIHNAFGGVRQIGVHHHQAVEAAVPDAVQHRQRQVARQPAANLHAHRQALGQRRHDGLAAVFRIVVYQKQFPLNAVPRQGGVDALDQLRRNVRRLAKGRHDNGDRPVPNGRLAAVALYGHA